MDSESAGEPIRGNGLIGPLEDLDARNTEVDVRDDDLVFEQSEQFAQILIAELLLRIYEQCHDPTESKEPFFYLLCNDGAIVLVKGKTEPFERHACDQAPSCGWDVGTLPITLPDWFAPSTSAIACTKKVALGLRQHTAFLLGKGDHNALG